jgi:hypothetical protein
VRSLWSCQRSAFREGAVAGSMSQPAHYLLVSADIKFVSVLTCPAWDEPRGHLIATSVPGTLEGMCRKCGKSIIKPARSRGLGTSPERSSWMTNDSDGDAICSAPPGGMPHEPQNDAEAN